jgi:Fe2+ or Zn2+ uptake regulation protein
MREKLNKNAQAILDVVRVANNHPTAGEIYQQVKCIRPQIGVASVYRILHNLAHEGYIREIGKSEECRYDADTTRHDHAICTACGALIDLPEEIQLPEKQLEAIAQQAGLALHSHEVRLYGLCRTCQANA